MLSVDFEWDPEKARANFAKHGIHFADVIEAFWDPHAITLVDTVTEGETRYNTLAMARWGELSSWSTRGVKIASASFPLGRQLLPSASNTVRPMRREYNFSRGKRGAVLSSPPGKTRVTIRLDNEILDWFRDAVNAMGGGNYQTLINDALLEHIRRRKESIEETLRRVVREELRRSRKVA